ncbi:hypothetical protein MLD38_036115 [Melastoma candidum]|uniref:Uncharacterized protein n=1 Tax=Melastoma candidum TaxID=119954 RepID=A0ACB9LIZ4_9MYRT|nr:hypothetical protein MLD38_036115 [Melastoma candidum]
METTKDAGVVPRGGAKAWEVGLRLLALALTLVASIILGLDKQTKVVPLQLTPSLPPLDVPVHTKWHYLSAFVFFVVANAVACTYAALSLILVICKKPLASSAVIVGDIVIAALLAASGGATGAIGVMGKEGNSHVRWAKVCDVFGKFCDKVAVSLVLSLLGSLTFLLLASFAVIATNRRSR